MKFSLRAILCASVLSLCLATTSAQTAPAAAPPAKPAVKTLSPAQQGALRAKAAAAFEVVTHAADTCPLRADQPMFEWRACLAGAVTTADANYKTYLRAVRTLLLTPKPEEVGDSGMQRWYADNTRDFDAASRAWSAYYSAQCKSETSTVEPGSGMAETQSNCQLALLKDRVQRMSNVYGQMVGLTAAK
jgi:uncharacterized protein YecT (DUF1311 family)